MEVLIVGPSRVDSGGIAIYINEQAKMLDHVNCATYDISPPSGTGRRWYFQAFIRSVKDALRFCLRRRPEIVHIHTSQRLSFIRASFYALYSHHVWRRPVILHIHGSSFDTFVETNSKALAWYQSKVFNASCRIIVLSEYWENKLSTRVSPDKIETIPNAVSLSEYDPEKMVDPPHIILVSNLIERKGISELVEVIRDLKETEIGPFQVTIAGCGPLSSKVEELDDEFEDVDYRGFVSEEEKTDILSEGSIYVLPSYAEGLPIAILEGMAGGNAIVSTSVGGIPEIVSDANGRIVEPGDVEALKEELRTLIADKKRTAKMGQRSRELCAERYSWKSVANNLEKIYRKCMEEYQTT